MIGANVSSMDAIRTVTVGGLTLNYGVLSYVNQAMEHAANEKTLDGVKALYTYIMAAKAYVD